MRGKCRGKDFSCPNKGELFEGCRYCGSRLCADCKAACVKWNEEVYEPWRQMCISQEESEKEAGEE